MSKLIKGNAVIGQSGGPTAVINQSLVGLIETLRPCRAIGRILGARHGVRGIVAENFIDLRKLDKKTLATIANTPAAALGSTRDKPDDEYCERIFRVFEKHNVRYFFYIGGNDSAEAALIINDLARRSGYELRTFHIPKTIDNDLRKTDHCPGYGSAAKFVASAFMGDDRDVAALPGIKINVVMGRHAGWLTAASVLGRQRSNDGPHLVYVPEIPFLLTRFIHDVRKVYKRLGRCQVAVSEGIVDRSRTPIAEVLALKLNKEVDYDEYGNMQLSGTGVLGDFLAEYVKKKLGGKKKKTGKGGKAKKAKKAKKGLRVRADTFGYLQRSFAGYNSSVDRAEARMVGRKAAQLALSGDLDGTVIFKRAKGGRYAVRCIRAKLKDVAHHTKKLPRKYINKAGNGITKAFRDYAMPLVGGLPVIGKLM